MTKWKGMVSREPNNSLFFSIVIKRRFVISPSTALSIVNDSKPIGKVIVLRSTLIKLYLPTAPDFTAKLWTYRTSGFGRILLTSSCASINMNTDSDFASLFIRNIFDLGFVNLICNRKPGYKFSETLLRSLGIRPKSWTALLSLIRFQRAINPFFWIWPLSDHLATSHHRLDTRIRL